MAVAAWPWYNTSVFKVTVAFPPPARPTGRRRPASLFSLADGAREAGQEAATNLPVPRQGKPPRTLSFCHSSLPCVRHLVEVSRMRLLDQHHRRRRRHRRAGHRLLPPEQAGRYTLPWWRRTNAWAARSSPSGPQGFVVDGGPDSFLTQKPWAVELCRQLGLDDQLIGTNEARRRVYVLWKKKLHDPSRRRPSHHPHPLHPLRPLYPDLAPGQAAHGHGPGDPAPARDPADETVASFVRRRLGSEALDKIAEPLMGGIHVSDPERQSLQASFPRFIDLERKHGSLIRGMLASRRKHAPAARCQAAAHLHDPARRGGRAGGYPGARRCPRCASSPAAAP